MFTQHRRLVALACLIAVPAWAIAAPRLTHDPRTTAKKLSQGLEIEGAGKMTINYLAHHFNAAMFKRAKASDRFLGHLNGQIWGRMGKATLDFPINTDDVEIPKGEYEFGVNFTKDDEFSLVFWKGEQKIEIPLEVEKMKREVSHLTIALMATDEGDTFVVEARCGPFSCTADIMVPYLDPEHDHHDEDKHEGDGDGGR